MNRLFAWIVRQDALIRRHYPKLWHLQTLYVVCFTILATIVAAIIAFVIPVDPTSIPSIEPGYFTLLLACAAAACIWLVILSRPMRWEQLAMPFTTPSLTLAALHVAALFLPSLTYGIILEHNVIGAAPFEEALIKSEVLRYYKLWQNDVINSYILLKFSDPPKQATSSVSSKDEEENIERPSAGLLIIERGLNPINLTRIDGSLPFAYFISAAKRSYLEFQNPFPSALFGSFSKAWKQTQVEGYVDDAAKNLRDCASVFMIPRLLYGTKWKMKSSPWPVANVISDLLKTKRPEKMVDENTRSAFDSWITHASAVRLEPSEKAGPTSWFASIPAGALEEDVSHSCPPILVEFPGFRLERFVVPEGQQSALSGGGDLLRALVKAIIKHHSRPTGEVALDDRPPFIEFGKVGGLDKAHLKEVTNRVVDDLDVTDSVINRLSRAQRAGARNFALSFLSYRGFGLYAGRDLLDSAWDELMWFGSRFSHVLLTYFCLLGVLFIMIRRILGSLSARAFWTAAACIALISVVYTFGWVWILICGLSAFALSLAVTVAGQLRPVVGAQVRVAAAVGLILMPAVLFATWIYLADFCKFSEDGEIQCFGQPYDIRLYLALAGLALMVMIGECYLAMLQRLVIKPR